MDIVDQAQDAGRSPVHPARTPGRCYNCLGSVLNDLRFCDTACRDDFAYRKAAETRRGITRHG